MLDEFVSTKDVLVRPVSLTLTLTYSVHQPTVRKNELRKLLTASATSLRDVLAQVLSTEIAKLDANPGVALDATQKSTLSEATGMQHLK